MQESYRERKRWLFFGLPFTFTVYNINDEILTIDKGFFNKTEDDIYMYKIADVKLSQSLFERIVGIGTVFCYTSDVTDPVLEIKHVKQSKDIKDYILKKSEEARLKRRTLNTQNIGANAVMLDVDGDGVIDDV